MTSISSTPLASSLLPHSPASILAILHAACASVLSISSILPFGLLVLFLNAAAPLCRSPVGCRRSAVFGGEDTGWTRVFCRMHRGENQTNLVLRAKPERSRPRLNKTSVAGAQNNFVPCSHVNEVRCRQGRATLGLMVRELKKPPEG